MMLGLLARHQFWWAPIVAGAMVAVGAFVLIDATNERDDLFDELQTSVATERARTDQVLALSDQLNAADVEIRKLTGQIAALIEQVSQLGGVPVVVREPGQDPERGGGQVDEGEKGPRGPRGPPGPRGPKGERQEAFCPVPFLCLPVVVALV